MPELDPVEGHRDPVRPERALMELTEVTVRFGGNVALDLTAAPLRFWPGSLVAVMGPNGSGKTTLLKLLAGLQATTTGTINKNPATITVAYVAQHQHQHSWMPLTVGEVLNIGRYGRRGLLGRLTSEDRSAIDTAAERLQVDHLVDETYGTLSGGQRQRVLVAASVAADAACLLLDEPITGLDLASQQLITEVVAAERDNGRLVVMSTHHLAEARPCDRVLLLNTTLVADGSPTHVLTASNLGQVFGARVLSSTGSPLDQADEPAIIVDDHGHGSHGPDAHHH